MKKTQTFLPRTLLAVAVSGALSGAWAVENNQSGEAMMLDEIKVTALRSELNQFSAPASVAVVEGKDVRALGKMQVELSDALQNIVGLSATARQNFAQDIQLSSRGSRSGTGVRGVRIYVDDIPATMPDGQGVSSHIDVNSLGKIEVLKGPFSAIYGNSSAGTILVQSEKGGEPAYVESLVDFGRHQSWHYGLKSAGGNEQANYVLSANRFSTQGERDHSGARKNQLNFKLNGKNEHQGEWNLVLNHSDIKADDPAGLTYSQWKENRHQVASTISQFNARKEVKQTQLGFSYRQPLNEQHKVKLSGYVGERKMEQYLAIPRVTQTKNPGHAGGVIELKRHFAGLDGQWQYQILPSFSTIAGVNFDYMQDKRKGYENFVGSQDGVKGKLRRDEKNEIYNLDPYLQAEWKLAQDWTLTSGVRYSTTEFKSKDHYITATNGDDSGKKRYHKWLPSAGLNWQMLETTNAYVAYSRGFETGTFLEMSYRPDGVAGLNFDLQPLTSDNYEVGVKHLLGDGLLNVALFRTDTKDDIISAGTFDGRATYRNGGKTRRQGAEIGWQGDLVEHLKLSLGYTYVDARFRQDVGTAIQAGKQIPTVAKHNAFVAMGWHDPQGWRVGADMRYSSKVYVNNSNSEYAPSYTVTGLYTGYEWYNAHWSLDTHARVNNLFNKDYIGTVIANDSNNRYYEPAPKRDYVVGASLKYLF